jgi:hypothetical protein
MEIYPEAVFPFVDGDDVLGQLFKGEHSSLFLPIELEGAVGEGLEEIAQVSIVS